MRVFVCGEGMTQTFPIPTHQSGSLEGKFIARMPAYRFTFRQLHRLLSGGKKYRDREALFCSGHRSSQVQNERQLPRSRGRCKLIVASYTSFYSALPKKAESPCLIKRKAIDNFVNRRSSYLSAHYVRGASFSRTLPKL